MEPESEVVEDTTVAQVLPQELLLLVFVHGFKGDDSTFGDFPSRLCHNLRETILNMKVESIVFPAYETKGELRAAVDKFVDWLATLTVEREVAHGSGGGAGKASIVLCGHSMGGLLIADTLIAMARSRPDSTAPLWPKIIALLSYDTPFYGLHPGVFKNKLTEGMGYVQKASQIAESLKAIGMKAKTASAASDTAKLALTAPPTPQTAWGKWAPTAYGVGGALLAGAAAGTAYWKREDLGLTYSWFTDHMKYVSTLWEDDNLKARVDKVAEISRELNIAFIIIYTSLPPKTTDHPKARTFVLLPSSQDKSSSFFSPNQNKLAEDEITAHTGIFQPSTNDGYYILGLGSAKIIREAVAVSRGLVDHPEPEKIVLQAKSE